MVKYVSGSQLFQQILRIYKIKINKISSQITLKKHEICLIGQYVHLRKDSIRVQREALRMFSDSLVKVVMTWPSM